MRRALLAGGSAIALLLALWLVSRQAEQSATGSRSSAEVLQRKLDALQMELEEERRARQILASEVELMREVLLEFGEEISLGGAYGDGSEGELAGLGEFGDLAESAEGGSGDLAGEGEAGGGDDPSAASARGTEQPVFQLDQLIAAGVDELEAQRVRDKWHEIQLERLELRDRATREGWLNSKRFKRRLERIKRESIEDLGECGYDSMLYGTGTNNRVVVRDVLEDSAAARAGLQSGDVVRRYNDNPIWASSDLQEATSRGERGETVTVDVDRNGEKLYLRVERGPFGMFMRQERVAPDGC